MVHMNRGHRLGDNGWERAMNMRKRLIAGIILGACASGLGLGSISANAATTGANAASSAAAASTPDHGCWNGCGGGGWGGGGRGGGGGWGGGYSCHRWYGWGPGPSGPYYGMHRHCDRHGGGGWDDGGGDGRDEG
jgi:hypothetical protein